LYYFNLSQIVLIQLILLSYSDRLNTTTVCGYKLFNDLIKEFDNVPFITPDPILN